MIYFDEKKLESEIAKLTQHRIKYTFMGRKKRGVKVKKVIDLIKTEIARFSTSSSRPISEISFQIIFDFLRKRAFDFSSISMIQNFPAD